MEQTAASLLELFVRGANITALHSEDWRRFYDFTIHCYTRHLPITGGTVRTQLLIHEFPPELAGRMSSFFEVFCELLARYDQQKTQ